MTDEDKQGLEMAGKFQDWVDSFTKDVGLFSSVLKDESLTEGLRRLAATGLSYLVRQLDFVPDHYQPTGVLDDCLVLRVVADIGSDLAGELDPDRLKHWFRLANDCEVVKTSLGDLYRPFENAVRKMETESVRKRTPDDCVQSFDARQALLIDVNEDMHTFVPPEVSDPDRAARELVSYLKAKLGA
ncbi:MAG: hypothetical protein J7M25_09265 [Deltaproteobacteria bacterium]|nr:hypothetical protein [Deltaproteobacteria bacterium]